MSDNKTAAKPAAANTAGPSAPRAMLVPASEACFATSAEFVSPLASFTAPAGTLPEQLLVPEYWANIRGLKPRVRIWVEEEAGAYVGTLYVLQAGQGYAKCCWLEGSPMALPGAGEDPEAADAGYRIEHRGHINKWRVVRVKDSHELKKGLDTKAAAEAWLREHKRMLAA